MHCVRAGTESSGCWYGLTTNWQFVEVSRIDPGWFYFSFDCVTQFRAGSYPETVSSTAGVGVVSFVVGGLPALFDDIHFIDGSSTSYLTTLGWSTGDQYVSTVNRFYQYTPPLLGAVSCSTCGAGMYQVDTACVPCADGYACPTPSSQVQCGVNQYGPPQHKSSSVGTVACNSCPSGSTSLAGSTSGYACGCSAGTKWIANPLGASGYLFTYLDADYAGTYSQAIYAVGGGFLRNYYGTPGRCVTCAAGTFSGPNSTLCETCPAEAPTTVVTVPVTVSDCKCAKGYYGSGASRYAGQNILTDCTICTAGSYSPTANSSS